MVEEITNQVLESLQAEALIPAPGERLMSAVGADRRDYPSFAEVVAQMKATQTPAQARDLSMEAASQDGEGYAQGLALRATFHNFGAAAEGRAAYARDPDQGYKIPNRRNLTWETKIVAAEQENSPLQEVAAKPVAPRASVDHGHHGRHNRPATHVEVVEQILPVYRGDYAARLPRCISAI